MKTLANRNPVILFEEISEENAASISGGATNVTTTATIIALDPTTANASLTTTIFTAHQLINGNDVAYIKQVATATTA